MDPPKIENKVTARRYKNFKIYTVVSYLKKKKKSRPFFTRKRGDIRLKLIIASDSLKLNKSVSKSTQ